TVSFDAGTDITGTALVSAKTADPTAGGKIGAPGGPANALQLDVTNVRFAATNAYVNDVDTKSANGVDIKRADVTGDVFVQSVGTVTVDAVMPDADTIILTSTNGAITVNKDIGTWKAVAGTTDITLDANTSISGAGVLGATNVDLTA